MERESERKLRKSIERKWSEKIEKVDCGVRKWKKKYNEKVERSESGDRL